MSDPRIRRGLEDQLGMRARLLEGGRRPLGWKAGFGAPAALEKLKLDGPLLGFLTHASILDDGAVVDIQDWRRPVAEPELAVWIGRDLSGNDDEDRVREAIAAISPSIEMADVDPPPDDVEEILAANIFHRAVVFGVKDPSRRGARLGGLEPRITVGGEAVKPPTDLEGLTGRLPFVLGHMARQLAEFGETIRAGEVVICGSITPPLDISAGTTVRFELAPFSPITVHTA